VIAFLAVQYLRLVYRTNRWQRVGYDISDRLFAEDRRLIFCFWHSRLLMMPFAGAGGLIAAGAGAALIATVFAAVYHAEIVAQRTGEPFGTLILAVAVTLGVVLLHEPLTGGIAVGFALILAGSVLAARAAPDRAAPERTAPART